MGLLYRETYEVPFYESDTNHYMKLPQLLALALQISAKQSLKLGIGDDIVFKRYGLVWVVTDYIIDIERLPKHAEKIVKPKLIINYCVTAIFIFMVKTGKK